MGSSLRPLFDGVFLAKLERTKLKSVIDSFEHYYHCDILRLYTDGIQQSLPNNTFHNRKRNEKSPIVTGCICHKIGRWSHTTKSVHKTDLEWSVYQQKRNLVKCFASRARKSCSVETLSSELLFIRDIYRESGYPDKFIEKNIIEKIPQNSHSRW